MMELCDWNKVESEEYKRINSAIKKTVEEIGATTGKAPTPGDHYLFDYAFIFSQIREFKGVRFLDLGSACSALTVHIARQGGIVTAVDLPGSVYDFASYFAELKEQLGIQITFSALDFCSDPLPKADVIISCSAIEHNGYEAIPQLVKNTKNALPLGGRFIFTVIAEPEPPEEQYAYSSYREDKIRQTFLQGFRLDKNKSNFDQFDTLYQRFRNQFPKYFYIPVGVSLVREDHE